LLERYIEQQLKSLCNKFSKKRFIYLFLLMTN